MAVEVYLKPARGIGMRSLHRRTAIDGPIASSSRISGLVFLPAVSRWRRCDQTSTCCGPAVVLAQHRSGGKVAFPKHPVNSLGRST